MFCAQSRLGGTTYFQPWLRPPLGNLKNEKYGGLRSFENDPTLHSKSDPTNARRVVFCREAKAASCLAEGVHATSP